MPMSELSGSPRDAGPEGPDAGGVVARVEAQIAGIAEADWDRCAVPDVAKRNPFLTHAFLKALEDAECVGPRTGWYPQHLAVVDTEAELLGTSGIQAVMPCYVKTHSQGEYVFDYGWADAFERAGGRYYPKLQAAVPFTPVTGRRFLVPNPEGAETPDLEHALLATVVELADRHGASSFHATFCTQGEWERLGREGLLQRTDRQFHWYNQGYATFDDFLSALASRKRKAIRKERETAQQAGEIEWITGSDLTEAHWDAFFDFYEDTGMRKWGSPYLNRKFFSLLGEVMSNDVLLVMVKRDGRYIAGALNLIGGDTLYGRYWGCTEMHPCLHFEVCYYQAIAFAIERGLQCVEAGAQGEHKLARGYVPVTTHSLHWIAHPGLRKAVTHHLVREREYVAMESDALREFTPFKKGG